MVLNLPHECMPELLPALFILIMGTPTCHQEVTTGSRNQWALRDDQQGLLAMVMWGVACILALCTSSEQMCLPAAHSLALINMMLEMITCR